MDNDEIEEISKEIGEEQEMALQIATNQGEVQQAMQQPAMDAQQAQQQQAMQQQAATQPQGGDQAAEQQAEDDQETEDENAPAQTTQKNAKVTKLKTGTWPN